MKIVFGRGQVHAVILYLCLVSIPPFQRPIVTEQFKIAKLLCIISVAIGRVRPDSRPWRTRAVWGPMKPDLPM